MGNKKGKKKAFMQKGNTSSSSFSSSSGIFEGQGRVLGSSSSNPVRPISQKPDPRPVSPHKSEKLTVEFDPFEVQVRVLGSSSTSNSVPLVINSTVRPISQKPVSPQKSGKLTVGFDPFKGQGRVLGSSSSNPSNSVPLVNTNTTPVRPISQKPDPKPIPPQNTERSQKSEKSTVGFDPFCALITTGKRNKNGHDLNVFECPVCSQVFGSGEEVTDHVERCLSENVSKTDINGDRDNVRSELEGCVGIYVSGKPSDGSVDIVLKLLRNVVKEPENVKFRRIRLGNPKIKEAIADMAGGLDLLECVGFELKEENGEMWAVMEDASSEKVELIKQAVRLLESTKVESLQPSVVQAKVIELVEVKKEPVVVKEVERQIRVFFSVSETAAAKIELPDSFYNLSIDEIKREAEMRRKKLAESQMLVPKSFKEKQTKAARKRHEKTVIRVKFPDGVVLQAFFNPREPTTALYEFVRSSLRDPSLEFELLHPVLIKRRVIPSFGEKAITLEEEDLVPSALIKFRPRETDSVVFTGLCNELLDIKEPLVSDTVC